MPDATLEDAGARISYTDTGEGVTPLLFVHGTGGNRRDFDGQVDHFSARHRVVAVDLLGHGTSDKPEQDYTFPRLADSLHELCVHLRLQRVVVIGHSMGGTIALDLATRYPTLLSALVLLDAPVLLSDGAVAGYRTAIDALHGPDFEERLRNLVEATVLPSTDGSHLERFVQGHFAVPKHVMLSVLHHGLDYIAHETEAAVAACGVPLLYIGAGPAAPGSGVVGPGIAAHVDMEQFHELCPTLWVAQTVGTGHHHHIEAPDQINVMIERFLHRAAS